MKSFFLILILLVFNSALEAQYKAIAPSIQLEASVNTSAMFREHFVGIKGGTKLYTGREGFYCGMDAIYAKAYTKSTWPNVGSYRYNTTSSILSPLIGYTFFRTDRFNLRMTLKCNFINTSSQLATDYPLLKNYLIEGYSYTHTSIGGSMHFLYRVTPNLGYFAEFNLLKIAKGNQRVLIGLGVTYNILNSH